MRRILSVRKENDPGIGLLESENDQNHVVRVECRSAFSEILEDDTARWTRVVKKLWLQLHRALYVNQRVFRNKIDVILGR
jgi:hypothetical protein